MLKILFRTVMILLVAGLVTGGLYLFGQNSGSSLIGAISGAGLGQGENHARPADGGFGPGQGKGMAQGQGRQEGPGGENSFSLSAATLSGLAEELGKVAAVTAGFVLLKAVFRLISRRKLARPAVA
jgi:hypothetical protein